MPLLSSGLRPLLKAGTGPFPRGTTITLPTTTWRFAQAGFASVAGGYQYDAKVKRYSDVTYGPSDRSGSMRAVEMSVDVIDTDRTIARYKEGAYGRRILGSAAITDLSQKTLAAASWRRLHTGIVVRVDFPEPLLARIVMRVDDLALEHSVPKGTWRITSDDWPYADASTWGKFASLVYGLNDSSGWTNRGFIPCLYVDKTGFRYLVCAGRALSVPAVYVAGVKASTSAYSITFPIVRGRQYTIVDFTSDQGTAAITANVQGYESVGDGTGTLLSLPTDQIAHYLTNFVFGDYMRGAWLSTSARIDSASLAALATFVSDRGYKGARRIDTPGKAGDQLTSWLTSLELVAWWTHEGTIAFGVEDFTDTNIYQSSPVALQPAGFATEDDDDRQVVGSVIARHVFDASSSDFVQNLQVQEPSSTTETVAELNMEWGSNS